MSPHSISLPRFSTMSLRSEIDSSQKPCGSHRGFRLKKILYAISTLVSVLLIIILIGYLIFHPSKPRFTLQNATASHLSFSDPPSSSYYFLNSTIQLTLLSQNPNSRFSIYYDQIRVYVSYKRQKVTADAEISPFYLGHQDASLIPTELYGNPIPMNEELAIEMVRDWSAMKMVLNVRVDGELKWKVGSWVSGKHIWNVECVAMMVQLDGQPGLFSLVQETQCSDI